MSRVMVTGRYEKKSFTIRYAEGEGKDQVHLVITPGEVIEIGNSIGGYWAKPIRYAGQEMISLVRLSGREKRLPAKEIRRICRSRRGFVLLPGMMGLWATSSGSALRGLLHRIGYEKDPIKKALRKCGMPSSLVTEVSSLHMETVWNGGSLCRHSTNPLDQWWYFTTDGRFVVTEEGKYVSQHANQYHIGCMESPEVATLSDATWVIQAVRSPQRGRSVHRLKVTSEADRDLVAKKVREMLRP